MNWTRIKLLLTAVIASYLSVAWVIKDTANPVQIYTGSNTSPSMSVATDGSISFIGTIKKSICTKSADYTVTDIDGCDSIFVTTSDTSRTITLPTASQNSGRSISIFKVDSAGIGNVTISGAVESLILIAANESMTVTSDGASWYLKDAKYTSGAYVPRDIFTFATTDVSTGADTITLTAHGLQTGHSTTLTTTGTLPAPLAAATTYYVVITSKNTFKLATSTANAFAGTTIDLTTVGTGTHTAVVVGSSNMSTWSIGDFAYSRQGNLVTVTGYINMDPNVTNTDTQLTFVLPTYRAQTAKYGTGSGVGFAAATSGDVIYRGLVIDSNHSMGLRGFPSNVSNVTVAINFSYPIL